MKKYLTIVYEITDMEEWRKINPLEIKHDGMQAISAGMENPYKKIEIMEELLLRCINEPCILTPPLRCDIESFICG